MSRARDFADLAGSADAGGLTGRNMVINGAMQVAQRGTSTTGSSSNNVFPACDRWKVGFTSGGTYDFSQSTDAPDGFSNSIKVKCASTDASIASGDEFVVQHRIEAQNLQQLAYGTSAAKDITLSFYAKAVNKTGTYCVHIQKNDSTAAYIYKEYTLTTSWQRFELTFPANAVVQASGGAIANDNGIGLIIMFFLMNGSSTQGTDAKDQWSTTNHRTSSSQVNFMDSTSNEWYITGVQLEVGEKATPFEHEPFTSQWHKCQRYCTVYNIGGGDVHPENFILQHHSPPGKPGHVDVNNRGEWQMEWPVKRAAPTLTFTDLTNMRWAVGNNGLENGTSAGAMSVGTSPEGGTVFQNVASGITQGASDVSGLIVGWVKQSSGNNPEIVIDAEL